MNSIWHSDDFPDTTASGQERSLGSDPAHGLWADHYLGSGQHLSTSACRLLRHFSQVVTLVQSLSRVRVFVTPWTAAHQASLSITNSWSLLKLMSIELVMPSNHLMLCHPLLLLPSIFPSIRVFSSESTLHSRWPKYWSFSCSISLFDDKRVRR